MSSYSLDVAFTSDQLATIYATGTNIVIAKPSGGSTPNVAWQVFKPMMANTLSWQENYGIYASTSEVVNGATLNQLSNVPLPAVMDKLYTLEANATISGPASGGTANAFSLENKFSQKSYMTVGLYQDAKVNGTEIAGNAVSAAPVILASTANMTPYTTVYVWLQSQVISNSVVTNVTSPMSELKFGGGLNDISVSYDSQSGHFIPVASELKNSVAHIAPSL